MVYIVLGIRPALDVIDIFHRWYKQGPETNNSLLSIGGATVCWSIWLTRSKVAFDKYQPKTFFIGLAQRNALVTTLGATTTVCDDKKEHIHQVCRELEATTMHFIAFFGWPNNVRTEF